MLQDITKTKPVSHK